MRVEEAVERLWPGRQVEIEPLGGGITNHNFRVSVDGEVLVLRIGGKDTALLGIDREHEHEAALLAAGLGIGPEVVRFEEGLLVTRFVEGEVGRADPATVGALLRRLHAGSALSGRFDSFRVVETYAATAAAHGVTVPEACDEAHGIAMRIEEARAEAPLVPCHNDLLAANFIDDGERLWIVDWEYAGMGDPYFDLANFAVNNGLDEKGERVLLDAYSGGNARGAHADALHVRFPRGDVGRCAAGDLGAGFRLHRLRRAALRAAGTHGRGQALPRRPSDDVGAVVPESRDGAPPAAVDVEVELSGHPRHAREIELKAVRRNTLELPPLLRLRPGFEPREPMEAAATALRPHIHAAAVLLNDLSHVRGRDHPHR